MKKTIIASLFLSSAAFAQAPPPMAPQQSEPVPITLDVQTQLALIQHLKGIRWEDANPVISTIQRLQEKAQRDAVTARIQAQTSKPPEAK